jgi:magnesium chelatase family protein
VAAARRLQEERGCRNSGLDRATLDRFEWDPEVTGALRAAMRTTTLTARGWDRTRRVAATIADLAESPVITRGHIMEALAYRGEK